MEGNDSNAGLMRFHEFKGYCAIGRGGMRNTAPIIYVYLVN